MMFRRAALFAVLFALAIVVGRQTVLSSSGLALFWPAAGVGALWLLGARGRREVALSAALVGALAAIGNGLTGAPLLAAALLGAANVVLVVVTRDVYRARRPGTTRLRYLAAFYRFAIAASAGSAASAVVGVLAISTTDAQVGWGTGIGWWMRNMTAVVVIAGPWVLHNGRRTLTRPVVLESLLLAVGTVLLVGWVFGPGQTLPLAFLPFVLVVWAGLRLPTPIAAAEGALVGVVTLVMVHGLDGGPFGRIGPYGERALVLQAFMLLAGLLAMVIATVRAQVDEALHGEAAARTRAEEASQDLRTIVEALPVGLFLLGPDGRVDLHNESARTLLGDALATEGEEPVMLEEVVRKHTPSGLPIPLEERPSTRALRGERVVGERIASTDRDGRTRVMSVDAVPLSHGDDVPGRAVLMWQDVTEDHVALERLRRERARADRLIADSPQGVAVLDTMGVITQANRALVAMLGRPAAEIVGLRASDLVPLAAADVEAFVEDTILSAGRLVEAEWAVPGPGGAIVHVATSSRFVPDPEGGEEIIVNVVDVSERRRYEERLAYVADHDALTGLPNRRFFEQALAQHQSVCDRYGPRGALLLVDLDHFKEVNDTLGHAVGDTLITSVGSILRGRARESDIVVRLGGDEFAVLLPESDEAGAETVARAMVDAIREHCASLDGVHQRVTASIGVVTFEGAAKDGSDVLVLADMLMYDAKDAGRDGYVMMSSGENRHPRIGARMEWRSRIEHALAHDGFELHLQPILDIRTGSVTRAESLVRLRLGDELVPPARFVYVAELTGLAPALDAWVLRHSVAMLADLQRVDPDFTLEVNVSGHSIGHPDVERALLEALEEHGVAPSSLVLEVTETAAVGDVPAAKGFGERLRALGTHFALDDFGAGYGSFYYLKHLVFDYVKIDGEFVTDALASTTDRQLLRSIVDVARNLGKGTVAEFVSSQEELTMVRDLGVDYAQGYFVGRPVAYDEFVAAHLGDVPAPESPESLVLPTS
ncbi:EAL domain-containing protein [Phycicoccus sp. BSK3Z-2]|uniref:EAL domain-containing protein n=1 Tax=Phycicoccus avicenniae TaxID=2828860 RepID=A0A941DAD5_9MICO|nr:EAL domain-containing protein [Phycicoccus avicenniae]MBR7743760.1 EAL domain-containing protein [Phycicoccus avicenniae]